MLLYLEMRYPTSRVKLFGWRSCNGVLPSASNISRRISNFAMTYFVCGHAEESDVHAVLECPPAVLIWGNNPFDDSMWLERFYSLNAYIDSMR